ncbi:MAG TPA: CHRD domain-containing protein, partial [Flavisolibacter sp.]|nr:CHRD domain-containing protein [Flavisolibacter sp.]
MYNLKRSAYLLFFIASVSLISCKKEVEEKIYSNNAIQLTPGQVIPPNNTTASGTMTASYSTRTRLLTYTINWSNLSGNVTAIHIHGLAGPGAVAIPAPTGPFVGGIAQTVSFPANTGATGSVQGSLLADGVVIREEDLLAGQFYVDIHTAAFPATGAAQLRGQITLN